MVHERVEWPPRTIVKIESVENRWDDYGDAQKVTLDCGHYCYTTGDTLFNRTTVRCKLCYEAEQTKNA